MTSEKKKEANKKNAQKSTGPKSDEGKSKSSGNAVKHGAYATKHLIAGEDQQLYEAIKSEIRNTYKPRNFIEVALVDELINQLWTLRRLERAQRYYLTGYRANIEGGAEEHPLSALARQMMPAASGAAPVQMTSKDIEKEFYEGAYVYDETGRIERLSSQKRLALQTILSIERELERRLRKKGKAKDGEAAAKAKS